MAWVVHEIEPFANMMTPGMENANKPYHMPLHLIGSRLLAALYWQALHGIDLTLSHWVNAMPRLSAGPPLVLAAAMAKCSLEDKW